MSSSSNNERSVRPPPPVEGDKEPPSWDDREGAAVSSFSTMEQFQRQQATILDQLKKRRLRDLEKHFVEENGLPLMTPERILGTPVIPWCPFFFFFSSFFFFAFEKKCLALPLQILWYLSTYPCMYAASCIRNGGYETPELNEKLYLHYEGFRRIDNLQPYHQVKALWLESNALSEISGLEQLRELRSLFLQNNLIAKIENLDNLLELRTLDLSGNRLTNLENLSHLESLTTLTLAKNSLKTVESIQELVYCLSVSSLDLSGNELADEAIIIILKQMPKLAVLDLRGNPIVRSMKHYRKRILTSLPSLTYLDDRPVFDSERKAVNAWAEGGREAEAEARRRHREEQRQKEQERAERFRQWQQEVREERAQRLAHHNAELRARGEPEVTCLPTRSRVTYTNLGPSNAAERAAERVENAARTQNGGQLPDDCIKQIANDFVAESNAEDQCDPEAVQDPGATESVDDASANQSHSGSDSDDEINNNESDRNCTPVNIPARRNDPHSFSENDQTNYNSHGSVNKVTHDGNNIEQDEDGDEEGKGDDDDGNDAVSRSLEIYHRRKETRRQPTQAEVKVQADYEKAAVERTRRQRTLDDSRYARAFGATIQNSSRADLWDKAMDSVLRQLLKKTQFNFQKTARALKEAIRRGAVCLPESDSSLSVGLITEEECRLRWADLCDDTVGASSASSEDLPEIKNENVKPISDLLPGRFELAQFKEIVKIDPARLPSMPQSNGSRSSDPHGHDSNSKQDDGSASESDGDVTPMTREELREWAMRQIESAGNADVN